MNKSCLETTKIRFFKNLFLLFWKFPTLTTSNSDVILTHSSLLSGVRAVKVAEADIVVVTVQPREDVHR